MVYEKKMITFMDDENAQCKYSAYFMIYWFSLTRILPYKDKIYDFVLIRENTSQ